MIYSNFSATIVLIRNKTPYLILLLNQTFNNNLKL